MINGNVEVEIYYFIFDDGDLFLLCSDGLMDMVDEWVIVEMIESYEDF